MKLFTTGVITAINTNDYDTLQFQLNFLAFSRKVKSIVTVQAFDYDEDDNEVTIEILLSQTAKQEDIDQIENFVKTCGFEIKD